MAKPLILYHSDCPDGFSAAWAAWKKFGTKAEYCPVAPNALPPFMPKKREIYILDNCYTTPTLLKLRMLNERVVVIDHHATNESHVRHATEAVFDMKHSGAVLAWQYFHPKKKLPTLLKYIEDGDLWKFRLPQAKQLLSYIYTYEFSFKNWEILVKGMESARERKKYLTFGKVIAGYDQVLVNEVVTRAELVQFGKYKVFAANSSSKRFHSEIGQNLKEKRPPLGIMWRVERGMIHVSLRANESVDAGKLAKQFPGGGGHPKAAGFSVPLEKGFPWKWLEK